MSVTVVYASPDVPRVRTHVQAFADAGDQAAAMSRFMTYNGHSPTPDRALDCFPKSRAEGDKLAAWAIRPEVMARFGIDYVIWYQRIYNPEIAPNWRPMADRGSNTANHKDHVHVSFNPTAPAGSQPLPQPQEDDMLIVYNPDGVGFLLAGNKFVVLTSKDAESLTKAGVKEVHLAKATVDALYA